jgi:hypothetical protein
VLRERVEVLLDPRRERVRGVAVVMEMKLHLTKACLRELRETVEIVRPVFLAGEEPAVSRRTTVAISKLTELGIAIDPRVDACTTDIVGGSAVEWLVVVTQREEYVARRV